MKYASIGLIMMIFLDGCTHVAPYEKENMATQKMLSAPMTTRSSFDAHVYPIREASFGAESGFSGGCGCK